MDLWFAGASALEVIRKVRLTAELSLKPVDELDPSNFISKRGAASKLNLLAMGLSAVPIASRPASIRVPKPGNRKCVSNLRCLLFPVIWRAHARSSSHRNL